MIEVIALAIGILGAISFYLLTSKNRFRMLLGFLLLSQGVHLFLFTRGKLFESKPPMLPLKAGVEASDPLVQALILTAIVISFAMISFAAALFLCIRRDEDRH